MSDRLSRLELLHLERGPERPWQQAVLAQVKKAPGWRAWHFGDSRNTNRRGVSYGDADAKAFPDTVLAHPDVGVIYAELKKQKGYSWGEGQREALDHLAATPGTYVAWWRPLDYPIIEAILWDLDLSSAVWWPESSPSPRPPFGGTVEP